MVPPEVIELASAMRAVADVDPAGLPGVSLVDGLDQLLRLEAQVRAVQLRWLEAAHVSDAIVAEAGRSPRSWLVEDQGLAPAEAGRRMWLSYRLAEHPCVETALRAGSITPDHAHAVLRACDGLTDLDEEARASVETALVDLARTQPPHVIGRAVEEIRARLGLAVDDDMRALAKYQERGVDLASTFEGTGSLAGTLTAEAYETLRVALDAAGLDAGGDEDTRTTRQRRHDNLLEMARFYLQHGGLADERGERPRVIVTMPLAALIDMANEVCTIGADMPLPAATARRIACDAGLIPAVLGGTSEILDLGHTTPTFNVAIRRAAWIRDAGHCAYPRCTRKITELHHIHWLSRGGETSLTNAAWLCSFHHWLVHEGRWEMRAGGDGSYLFTDPHGRKHVNPPPGQRPPGLRPPGLELPGHRPPGQPAPESGPPRSNTPGSSPPGTPDGGLTQPSPRNAVA